MVKNMPMTVDVCTTLNEELKWQHQLPTTMPAMSLIMISISTAIETYNERWNEVHCILCKPAFHGFVLTL